MHRMSFIKFPYCMLKFGNCYVRKLIQIGEDPLVQQPEVVCMGGSFQIPPVGLEIAWKRGGCQ